jgi:hypothetical protein
LFIAAAAALWSTAGFMRRIADVHQRFAMLTPGIAAEYGAIEGTFSRAGWMPWVGERALADTRSHRALAEYWHGNYSGFANNGVQSISASGDPELMFLAANAAYRVSQQQNTTQAAFQHALEGVIDAYAQVLKKNPADIDAAFNYEFVIRLRNNVPAKRRATVPVVRPQKSLSDLPPGLTVHGRPGAPPAGAKMDEFNIVIPLRPDERDDFEEAGRGTVKVRKG